MSRLPSPNWKELTAVFGGTFDPPHLGHLEAVRGLFENPGIGQVVIMPAAHPPHKPCIATPEQRVEMTRLCFGSESKSKYHSEIRVDLTELEISHARSPGFTFDVLTALERKGQNLEKLAFVMGTDQLARFHTWHRYRELLSLCHWIVLARKPEGDRQAQKTLADWQGSGLAESAGPHVWRLMPRQTPAGRSPKSMILVETSAPALSSTGIREALGRTGEVPEKSLPELVSRYLKLHRIYGTAEHPSEHCPR